MAKREFIDELDKLEELMRLAANDKSGEQFVAINFSRGGALRYAKAIKKIRSRLISLVLNKDTPQNAGN